MIENYLTKIKQNSFALLLVGACAALAVAYFFEYVINFPPCSLCILQRIPYFILIILAAIALLQPKLHRTLSLLSILACSVEIFLASYHVGIEHYIFEESYMCQMIVNPHMASSCALVHFRFMNLSMAEWNLIYIMFLLYYFIRREMKDHVFTRRS